MSIVKQVQDLVNENERAPILGRGSGLVGSVSPIFDYARARRRPSVSPEGKAAIIDMHMSIRMERFGTI